MFCQDSVEYLFISLGPLFPLLVPCFFFFVTTLGSYIPVSFIVNRIFLFVSQAYVLLLYKATLNKNVLEIVRI